MSLDLTKLLNVKNVGDGITAACPACREEGADSKGVHLFVHKTGAYKCVKDGSKEHSKKIYGLLSKSGFVEAKYEYFDYTPKITIPKIFPEEVLNKLIPDYTYWENRKINKETVQKIGGGISPEDEKNKLSNRFVHPLRNINGELIGFAGRSLIDSTFSPKWKIIGKKNHFICPQPNISNLLKYKKVILTEGLGDILCLGQHNVWNTLCLFGLNISSEQIGFLISQNVSDIIIATNNEETGIGNKAAEQLKKKLSKCFDSENIKIKLPPRKDFMESIEQNNPQEIEEWKKSL